MASDWTNAFYIRDVSNDGVVSPLDALLGINELEQRTIIFSLGELPDRADHSDAALYDVSGDNFLSPIDVLLVINGLNEDLAGPSLEVGLTNDTAPLGSTNTDLVTSDGRISGKVLDDLTGVFSLEVAVDQGQSQVVTFSPNGDFSFDPGITPGNDKSYTLLLTAIDGRGISNSRDFTFVIDSSPPEPPSQFTLATGSDTGSSTTDGITNENTPTFSGDASSGSTIALLANGQLVANTTANSPWQLTAAELEDGEYEFTITAQDAAGNNSQVVGPIHMVIDTTAPSAPAGLQLTATTDTGSSQSDGITKNTIPTIVGSAEDGTTVSIFRDEELVSTVGGGLWEFTLAEQPDGVLGITATALDVAGNVSPLSAVFSLTIDTQVPAPPTDLRLTTESDTGQSSTDGITRNTTLTYTATAEPGALVRLFVDDELATSATANSPVLLPLSEALTEGQHTAFVTAEDLAGNLSAPTTNVTTVVDTTAPAAATVELSATSDTGTGGDQTTSAGRVTLVGTAGAKAEILLSDLGISALASQAGAFQLLGVPLEPGDNVFNVDTLDEAGNATSTQVTLTRDDIAAGLDPVLRWNQEVLDAIKRDASTPPQASRFMAMLHVAIFDAVSNIDGTPSYFVNLAPPSGASAEAAVSTAAHEILSYSFPGQTSWFDTELADALSGIPNGTAKTDGEAFGRTIADAVIQLRNQDGWNDFVDYVPSTNPGDWRPTEPMFDPALLPHWAQLDPFAMTSQSQFRPAGPPDLHSVEYATAVNELKELGRNLGSGRTADQTSIARFWADGPGTFTPPGHWNDIAQDISADRESSLAENARLFAMLNVALADAAISAWNTKFHYNFWRPIDAIQRADEDGNDQTADDSTWQPLLISPPFPDYTSGHSTFSGAAAQILTNAFGDDVSFTTNSPGFVQADGVTPVQRSFTSFEQAANEAGRSRVFGGIHYEFANQDGLASGRSLAQFVWENFSTAVDEQAPRVIVLTPPSGHVASSNLTLAGRVLDNVSGVQSLEVASDGGPFTPVQVAADGSFTVTPSLATDGTADGTHRLQFKAVDFRGNSVTTSDFLWTLDTRLPTISITTTPEDGRLAGTVNGTGSTIKQLQYRIGNGEPVTISLPDANGSFGINANLSRLAPGTHTVHVTATDSAGLMQTASTPFNLESRIAFRVTNHTPRSGQEDIGATYRPQVFFSRPVDTDTLNPENFYATDSTGEKVPATIVPALDGSFAWLFFTDPLPGASTITVYVEGDTIAAESDGAGLDADSDGESGGTLTFNFSTVRLTPLSGTTLSGKVVDPGVDLKPMTFDDIRPGPDGVLHTPDDRFLLPIAGVRVFILGLEDDFVLTDANGNFSFDAVPGGNVKLAVDGRTATNPPTGVYFPEMVMDMYLRVGAANTVMGTMGTREEMLANIDRPEVYLPRIQTDILQTVSNTQDTLITVDGTAAPNLTDDQRQFLTLEVQPQSLVGPDGQPVVNGQVGLSTVPPELVREMLPPGLLQHTFDITIQAPAAATFSSPLTLTLPNVFNSPPGTKLNFLSFDHTTGRLVIEGTGTVSEDGLSVVTDEGTGITKPGWHGFTPPGTDSDPPCKPNAPKTIDIPPVPFKGGLEDQFFKSDDGSFTLLFRNDAQKREPSQDPCAPENLQVKPLVVDITVEGNAGAGQFLAGIDRHMMFELQPEMSKEIKINVLDILTDEKVNLATAEVLYGAKFKVEAWKFGEPGTKLINEEFFAYRFFDIADNDHTDGKIEFPKTFTDGAGDAFTDLPWNQRIPDSAKPTYAMASGGSSPLGINFEFRNDVVRFDPVLFSGERTDTLNIKTPEGVVVGSLSLVGNAIPGQRILFPKAEFRATITSLVDRSIKVPDTDQFVALFPDNDGDGLRSDEGNAFTSVVDSLYTKTRDNFIKNFESVSALTKSAVDVVDSAVGDGIKINFLYETFASGRSIDQTAHAAGVNGASFDANTAKKAVFRFTTTAIPAGHEIQLKYQASDDNAAWTDLLTATLDSTKANKTFVNKLVPGKRYLRIVTTHTGADPMTYDGVIDAQRNQCDDGAACAVWDDFKKNDFIVGGGAAPITGGFVKEDNKTSQLQEIFRFSSIINRSFSDPGPAGRGADAYAGVAINLDVKAGQVQSDPAGGGVSFLDNMAIRIANSMTHETGHDLGTFHVRNAVDTYVGTTIMGEGSQNNVLRTWGPERAAATKLALGVSVTPAEFTPTYDNYKQFIAYEGPPFNLAEPHSTPVDEVVYSLLDVAGVIVAEGALAPVEDTGKHHSASAGSAIDVPFGLIYDGPVVVDGAIPRAIRSHDFGSLVADGVGNQSGQMTIYLINGGGHELEVTNLALQRGTSGFSIVSGGATPFTLPPLDPDHPDPALSTRAVTLQFDPITTGSFRDALLITSNTMPGGATELSLLGSGVSAGGDIQVEIENNNLGGRTIGQGATTVTDFGTVRNVGSSTLTITAADFDDAQFSIHFQGAVGELSAGNPLQLAPGASARFDASFDPSGVGLQHGRLQFVSNDLDTPTFVKSAIGTGLADGDFLSALSYGEDFVVVEMPLQQGTTIFRTVSDPEGSWTFFLPPEEAYHHVIFDPLSGLVAHGRGTTNASGSNTLIAAPIFDVSAEPDSDEDGLPDDIEFSIGSDANKADTDGDLLPDGVEIKQGWDPLDDRPIPLGIIANLPLRGEANEIVLEGSFADAAGQTAYVATGSYGLGIVNATKFYGPIALGQIDLLGNATDVAVDSRMQLAVVATNTGGVQIVDVSDPRDPQLASTLASQASQVEVLDGVAYVNNGTKLQSYDLVTGVMIHELDLVGGSITSIARERSMLYTLDADSLLRAVDISGQIMVRRDSLALPVSATKLFVASGIAYIGDSVTGGLATVDVSNANDLTSIAGPSDTSVVGADVVATGSGQALSIGTSGGDNKLQLLDVSTLSQTGEITNTFGSLPGELRDIAVGGGFGYVAAGSAGLLTINYLGFDTDGENPSVDVGTNVTDQDLDRPGVQVLEGTTIPLTVAISDDVQVRNVELLVDGQVVRNDVSFPFDFSALALTDAANGQVRVQVRATDTGGNVGVSRELILEKIADTTAPAITDTSPNDGATRGQLLRTVQVEFSESMAASTLTTANIELHGPGGAVIAPIDIQIRNDDRFVQLTYPTLDAGDHQIVIKAAAVTDRAGNALGTSDVTSDFTVSEQAISWINLLGGEWNDPNNWDQGVVPGPFDHVVIDIAGNVEIFHSGGDSKIASLYSSNRFTLSGGNLTVNETVKVDNAFLIDGGTLTDATVLAGADGQGVLFSANQSNRLDGVTVNANMDLTRDSAVVRVANGLTLNGRADVWGTLALVLIEGSQTIASGQFVLNTDLDVGLNLHGGIAAATAGATLQLGSDVTIEGHGLLGVNEILSLPTGLQVFPFFKMVNQGEIVARDHAETLTINASEFLNEGALKVRHAGRLFVNGMKGDVNTVEILHPDSELFLRGNGYVINDGVNVAHGSSLILGGEWTNAEDSTISATNAEVTLGTGERPWSNEGSINLTDSQVTIGGMMSQESLENVERQGGELQFFGVLDNAGQSLALDTFSADWNSGRIRGGMIFASNSLPIQLPANMNGTQWELEDTLIDADIVVPNNVVLQLEGNWKNEETVFVDGGTLQLGGEYSAAEFGDIDTSDGGSVHIAGEFDNTGATFQLDDSRQGWLLAGGTIIGGTITFADPDEHRLFGSALGGTLDGVTVQGDLELSDEFAHVTIAGGTTFETAHLQADQARLLFAPNQTLTGTVLFEAGPCEDFFCAPDQSVQLLGPDASLTIGPTGAIRTVAGFEGNAAIRDAGFDTAAVIVNQGTIGVGPETDLSISAAEMRNNGTISVAQFASLFVSGLTGSVNDLEVDADGASIALDGHDFVINQDFNTDDLSLSGTWINNADITVDGSTLALNSGFTPTPQRWHNPGTIQATNVNVSIGGIYTKADLDNITRNGGTASLGGTLDNSNSTLAIDALLAEWSSPFFFAQDTLTVRGGTITDTNDSWVMSPVDRVRIDGATLLPDVIVPVGARLEMAGAWTSAGMIDVTGSLLLGGEMTTAGLGVIENTSGSVVLSGRLDNTGANLTLDDGTGVWTLGSAVITGGTLTVGDGSHSPIEGATSLDGVDVEGELFMRDPQIFGQPSLTLLNGTTFDKIHLAAVLGAELLIGENQTITGEVLLHGLGDEIVRSLDPDETLTIGATGAIRTVLGSGNFFAPFLNVGETEQVINEGTMEADQGQTLLVIPGEMINRGILRASHGSLLTVTGLTGDINTIEFGDGGGNIRLFGNEYNINTPIDVPALSTLSLNGHWTNSAGITSQNGTVELGGHDGDFGSITLTDSTLTLTDIFTMADYAAIQRTGGIVQLFRGSLDNNGETAALDTLVNDDWRFVLGEISGGTVTTTTSDFELPAGSDLTLKDVEFTGTIKIPVGAKLTLRGEWTNTGTIIVDGGELYLGGIFDNSKIGDIQRNDGQVILRGVFDNRGEMFALDNSTGSWRIEGGEIRGGTVNLDDGQTLIGTHFGGELTGVEVQGDLTLEEDSATLFLAQGTTFENAHLSGNASELSFGPNETISGNILFEGSGGGNRFIRGEGLLTIDSASQVRTVVGFSGGVVIGNQDVWLVNEGAILSAANNTTVNLDARTLENSGRIESSNGGVLEIRAGNWENTGTLKTDNGTLSLNGDYATASITADRLERVGGTINLRGWLNNIDSTLALDASTGPWNVDGAEIYGGTYTAADGEQLVFTGNPFFNFTRSTLNGLIANGPLDLSNATVNVRNGLTLNSVAQVGGNGFGETGSLAFSGTQTLDGTGEVTFGMSEFNGVILSDPNTTLTIGAGITIHGHSGQIGGAPSQFAQTTGLAVVNRGLIDSSVGSITIGSQPSGPIGIGGQTNPQNAKGGTFLNLGTLRVGNGATLKIRNMIGSIGNVDLAPSILDGVTLSLDGTDYFINRPLVTRPGSTLELFGSWRNLPGNTISIDEGELTLGSGDDSWHNLGTISATDSTVNLDGLFRKADLGTYQRTGAIETNLRGTLDNANATLALNASTGSWNLMEGTIRGGTITQSAGAALVLSSGNTGTFDGVTFADDLVVEQDFELTIRNGLTLDTATLTLAAVDNVCCEATVNFEDSQSVLGDGDIILNTNNFGNAGELNVTGDNPGLTIGPQVTVRGAGFIGGEGPLTVQGTIVANIPGETLVIEGEPVTNQGTIRAENSANLEIIGLANEADVVALADSELTLDGEWSNTGTIAVTDAVVNLGGEFQTSSLGSFDRDGGTVNLTGTLDNTGSTLALDQSTGSWNLRDGTIRGGDYTAADGAKLTFTEDGGELDGLTAGGDFDLTQVANAQAHVLNGLTLDNSSILIGNAIGTTSGGLFFDGTSLLGGTGSVVFGKNASNFLYTFNTTFGDPEAGTLTIGADITIRGSSGSLGDSFFTGRIVNAGQILADDSGGASSFNYDRNFNGGFQTVADAEIDTTGVTDLAPQLVYQTARTFGDFTYTFEGLTASASHTLRLHFAEILDAGLGERLFDVVVNGATELDEFDIVAEAGAKNKAVVQELTVSSDVDGKIVIEFKASNNSPLLSGLEVKSGTTVLHAIDAGQMAGGTFTIFSQFSNSGTIEVHDGESLTINNLISPNTGTIKVEAGGQLNFSGDYSQASSGTLAIDVAGTVPGLLDLVTIGGTATLDGDLQVAIVDGFVPAVNDMFVPITYGAVSGQFSNIETSGLPAGTAISETYNANDLTLTVVAALRGRVVSDVDHVNRLSPGLDADAIAPILAAAINQWCGSDAARAACQQLGNVQIIVTNLGGDSLGLAAGNRIWIDDDAAGIGWFLDETTDDDSEFEEDNSPAGYDLLTVLAHEIGHLLGADHSHAHDSYESLMDDLLDPGVRRSLASTDLDTVFGEDTDWIVDV